MQLKLLYSFYFRVTAYTISISHTQSEIKTEICPNPTVQMRHQMRNALKKNNKKCLPAFYAHYRNLICWQIQGTK